MDHDRQAVDQPVIGQESQSAFTPGPWSVNVARLSDNSINVVHVLGPKGQGLAQVGVYGETETLANAHMFAAAPDLYAAIRNSDDAHWTTAMRAALAKAEGR